MSETSMSAVDFADVPDQMRLYEGTSEIQRLIVGGGLLRQQQVGRS
jgi:hypothetical protein